MKIAGKRFDFFAPDSDFEFAPNSCVLTMCALEQVGERFLPFLDFIREKRPRRVVHVEPILELYDPQLPHDALAIRYHQQRRYLSGLLPHLQSLERAGFIQFLKVQRLKFGSRFHECFTVVAWEPVS